MSVKRWVVLEPPSDDSGIKSAEAMFVKDAFAPLAFLFLIFWLFWHRLWLAGIAVLVLDIAFMAIGWWQGLGLVSSVAQFLLALLVGLEGRNLLIDKRLRKGWRLAAVFQAGSRSEAELRYYEAEAAASPTEPQRTERPLRPRVQMPWSVRAGTRATP
ncbi:DUF2628 domain-containing protein [Fulvimarina endophytica]|nr:DUF2628 domain-containing protein [Fulvimarina endophytica]